MALVYDLGNGKANGAPINGNRGPGSFGSVEPDKTRNRNNRISDPASGVPSAPPNFGSEVLPHVVSFQGFVSSISHAYRASDEALRHSMENARFMRNDPVLMAPLEARQRGTAMLNWHLEPEDAKDAAQKELAEKLTDIVKQTPRFAEYRRWLMEALWFGRVAIQNQFKWQFKNGQKRLTIGSWLPIHGDKLVFRFDDGSGEFEQGQLGIKIGQQFKAEDIAGRRKPEATEFGLAYFLRPWERSLLTLHQHMIEDSPYEDPQAAGSIYGVGIRHRLYHVWYQKQEALGFMMEVIERTGMGWTVWYYPAGNPQAKADTEEAAKKQTYQNVVLIPRTPGDPAMDGYGIDRIEPNGNGIEQLRGLVEGYFGDMILRYILGQTLSMKSDSTGLGSGVAELHYESLLQLIQYDATNLEETLTKEVIVPLQQYNFPEMRDTEIRFVIDTESQDTEKKLEAVRVGWEMGLQIKSSDVFDILGMSPPTEDDEVLASPMAGQGGQQPTCQPGFAGISPTQALMQVEAGIAEGDSPEVAAGKADTYIRRKREDANNLMAIRKAEADAQVVAARYRRDQAELEAKAASYARDAAQANAGRPLTVINGDSVTENNYQHAIDARTNIDKGALHVDHHEHVKVDATTKVENGAIQAEFDFKQPDFKPEINVMPASVHPTIENHIDVPPTEVRPVINVEAPKVEPKIEVNIPEGKSKGKRHISVKRDGKGNVTGLEES